MQIIILGAGIVGLTAASLLAQEPSMQIILIDPQPQPDSWSAADYDIRCSAINHASQHIFKHIGVWSDIIADRAAAYYEMLVWDQDPNNKIHFDAADIAAENLGHVIENRVINKALYNHLLEKSNVTIIAGSATALEYQKDSIKITVGSENISCSLVVGADGSNSWLRGIANIQAQRVEYGHAALVACIESALPHNQTAMQCFMPDGPLAFLPLAAPNLSSIVWSSKPEIIDELISLEANVFCERLAATFSHILGPLCLHGKRASFPLHMLHATQYVMPRIALIGDAAHVIHPLAGQGLNLGLLDAMCLYECVHNAINHDRDIGGLAVLRQYERGRKGHNLSMIALVGSLKHMFASENLLLKNIRSHGIRFLDSFAPAKSAMIRFATGL